VGSRMWGFLRNCWLRVGSLRGHEQAVSALGYGFNELRLASLVTEDAPQFGDGSNHNIVGDKRVRPYCVEEVVLGDRNSRLARQTQKDFHHLRFQPNGTGIRGDNVKSGLDQPASNTEVAIHSLPHRRYSPTL